MSELKDWSALLAAHGLEEDCIECRRVRGKVTDVYFSTAWGRMVVEVWPFAHATVSPENIHLFAGDGRRVMDMVGEWHEITLAYDADIWMHNKVEPTLFERALYAAWSGRWRLRFLWHLWLQVRHGPWRGFGPMHPRTRPPEPWWVLRLRALAAWLHPPQRLRPRRRRRT